MSTVLLKNLRDQIHDLAGGKPWLDETLHGKLDGVTEAEAFVRPLPEVHSVAELVSHLQQWRQSILSVLNGKGSTLSEQSPFNWMGNGILQRVGWESSRRLFFDTQQALLDFLADKDDAFLERQDAATHRTYRYYLEGLIHHDTYHLGQIGLVIKLVRLQKPA